MHLPYIYTTKTTEATYFHCEDQQLRYLGYLEGIRAWIAAQYYYASAYLAA